MRFREVAVKVQERLSGLGGRWQQWEEREVDLAKAVGLLSLTLVFLVLLGSWVGYRFFWNRFDPTPRLERELARWSQAVVADEGNAEAHYQLGWVLFQKGALDEAAQHYGRVLELQPEHVGARYNLGMVYLEKKMYGQAAAEFKAVADKYPRHEQAYQGLGRSYLELGRLDEALTSLRHLVWINPTSADARYYLGLAYERKGDRPAAIREMREALKYDPQYQPAREALSRLGG